MTTQTLLWRGMSALAALTFSQACYASEIRCTATMYDTTEKSQQTRNHLLRWVSSKPFEVNDASKDDAASAFDSFVSEKLAGGNSASIKTRCDQEIDPNHDHEYGYYVARAAEEDGVELKLLDFSYDPNWRNRSRQVAKNDDADDVAGRYMYCKSSEINLDKTTVYYSDVFGVSKAPYTDGNGVALKFAANMRAQYGGLRTGTCPPIILDGTKADAQEAKDNDIASERVAPEAKIVETGWRYRGSAAASPKSAPAATGRKPVRNSLPKKR